MNIKFINKETIVKEFENYRKEVNLSGEITEDEIQTFCALKSLEIEKNLNKSAALDIMNRIEKILKEYYNLKEN